MKKLSKNKSTWSDLKFQLAVLEHVRQESHNWGWGAGDDMDDLMTKYGFTEE